LGQEIEKKISLKIEEDFREIKDIITSTSNRSHNFHSYNSNDKEFRSCSSKPRDQESEGMRSKAANFWSQNSNPNYVTAKQDERDFNPNQDEN
jgi:hypothetical protein